MRNVFLLGLLALVLSVISTTATAGNVEVCEQIKDDPAYKGLYGLCTAYWNETDEQARADILAAFQAKAGPGGPTMPGLDEASCPCWDQAYLDATIDAGLSGTLCLIDPDGSFSDIAVYTVPSDSNLALYLEAGYLIDSPFEGTGCVVAAIVYPPPDGVDNFTPYATDPVQDAKCSELLLDAMRADNFIYDCGQDD
jgi:hypothetical protein